MVPHQFIITVTSHEQYSVSYHQQLACLYNRLFRLTTGKHRHSTWWRHQMETFSALLALCAGNSPVPVNSPHKGQWRGALMFSLICVWINGWVNNRKAGDLRRQRGDYDVIVMTSIHRWPMDISCKRIIMQKAFSCHDTIIKLWNILISISKLHHLVLISMLSSKIFITAPQK